MRCLIAAATSTSACTINVPVAQAVSRPAEFAKPNGSGAFRMQ